MNTFRTVVEISPWENKIGYDDPSVWMGSCFTENIGNKMKRLKFPVQVNPFGVIYNPVSVKNSLEVLIEIKFLGYDDLKWHNNMWHSFYHHSSFSHPEKDECLDMINSSIKEASSLLREARFLFITFGTARVYEYIETGRIVSNCHKIPAANFRHYLLEVDYIVEVFKEVLNKLSYLNPAVNVVFTISPVRHWKDGPVGNQLSKSSLIVAVQRLVELFSFAYYFPAYEIVMDDLRDYRFYEKDMLHVGSQAVDYIWEKFSGAFISHNSALIMREVEKICQALSHKPFNPASPQHRSFLQKVKLQIGELEKKYPFLNFREELNMIEDRLKKADG